MESKHHSGRALPFLVGLRTFITFEWQRHSKYSFRGSEFVNVHSKVLYLYVTLKFSYKKEKLWSQKHAVFKGSCAIRLIASFAFLMVNIMSTKISFRFWVNIILLVILLLFAMVYIKQYPLS